MSKKSKNNLLVQGSILAVAGLFTKIIGITYRAIMTDLLGPNGNGLYSAAFNIYGVVLTLSSYSLPLAVSKLISQRNQKKEYLNSRRVVRNAFIFAIISGLIACFSIYFFSNSLETWYKREGLSIPLKIIAPTTFIMALLGIFRGLFQGGGTMVPTAISQILEQIVNAVVSILAIKFFMNLYHDSKNIAAYGAAGGIAGTLAGALTALLFLFLLYLVKKPFLNRQLKYDRTAQSETNLAIYKVLLLTIIPVVLSQTVYQLGNTLDDLIFVNIMTLKGYKNELANSLQGVFSSQYNILINVPVAVASAMGASSIPSIVASKAKGSASEVIHKVRSVIKFNMVIAFPCAVGLTALSRPIVTQIFPRSVSSRDLASGLLLYGSLAVIFFVLSTITSSILQAVNCMRLPVYHAAVSLLIHIMVNAGLLYFTDLGVYALIIGNITFPLVICVLNWRSVSKVLGYHQEVKKTFVVPLAASVIMGAFTRLCYEIIYLLSHNNSIALLPSMIAAFLVYFILILILKCFSEEELYDLPMGGRIVKLARKLHLG